MPGDDGKVKIYKPKINRIACGVDWRFAKDVAKLERMRSEIVRSLCRNLAAFPSDNAYRKRKILLERLEESESKLLEWRKQNV